MRMEPQHRLDETHTVFTVWGLLTALAVLTGLALSVDAIGKSSATYDEVAYLRVAAHWWRSGDQSEITRMGSPLTFWKLQQTPVLWLLDSLGRHEWIGDPIGHQRQLLPLVRFGSLWIWLAALALTAAWSHTAHGPRAMALAAWLFALSPNLIAHGSLATMELPLAAATTAMFWSFWQFLASNHRRWFWMSAVAGGLAFSCKFTAFVFPPILCVIWWLARWQDGERGVRRLTRQVALSMVGFVMLMLVTNLVATGFARIPASTGSGRHPTLEKWLGTAAARQLASLYETPLPQDWVGFATQMHHQASGGASYLWGERRSQGWWYYYLVALAVKVPLAFWLLVAARLVAGGTDTLCPPPSSAITPAPILPLPLRERVAEGRVRGDRQPQTHINLIPLVFLLFLTITAVGSSRNYGVRYLLPMAPLAIVWVSALAEKRNRAWPQVAAAAGVAGLAVAIAGSHPHELTYFNILAGGPEGGRHILSDSNLDWGQGLENLVRLQSERPDFQDMTLYYFGDTDPVHYGVAGHCYVINAVDDHSRLSGLGRVETSYLAVSASLQWGPWGPPGFFHDLDQIKPVRFTDDTTIAIYRTADLRKDLAARQ
jgi:Dolichyl-phosphate-mannose-protein mannosyltransferase